MQIPIHSTYCPPVESHPPEFCRCCVWFPTVRRSCTPTSSSSAVLRTEMGSCPSGGGWRLGLAPVWPQPWCALTYTLAKTWQKDKYFGSAFTAADGMLTGNCSSLCVVSPESVLHWVVEFVKSWCSIIVVAMDWFSSTNLAMREEKSDLAISAALFDGDRIRSVAYLRTFHSR